MITEAILLSIFAWNSLPIVGTDIPRSLVTMGQEFCFPIDYFAKQYVNLTSSDDSVESYSTIQAKILLACHEVFKLLIHKHQQYHRKYINS